MNTTRQQRRMFVNNAKKEWKKGLMSKAEYLEVKASIANMGKEQNETLQQTLLENNGVTVYDTETSILDTELVDNEDEFTPDDL